MMLLPTDVWDRIREFMERRRTGVIELHFHQGRLTRVKAADSFPIEQDAPVLLQEHRN